jgi:hypothetical protein
MTILRRVVMAARMIASALRDCPRDVKHLAWTARQAASFVVRGECRAFDPAHIERASVSIIETWPLLPREQPGGTSPESEA